MGSKTKIEWAEATWNPVTGCSPVSIGCEHCYAKRLAGRFPQIHSCARPADRPEFNQIVFHHDRLDIPFHWRKPKRIFVCSMGDLFHEKVTDIQINEVWNVAFNNPRHIFVFLTKRPDRLLAWTKEAALVKMWPRNEIWPDWMLLGVTAENQEMADKRIPILLQIPAAKHFVSYEPGLGLLELQYQKGWLEPFKETDPMLNITPRIDWVICGPETGPGARPMNLDWARSLRDQCVSTGVPFFYKNGELDGKLWQQFPEV